MPNLCSNSGQARALTATATTTTRRELPLDRQHELVTLVQAARAGDAGAWTRLVQRFDGMLRHIARSYRLGHAEVDDVVQMAWLDLFEGIEHIRDPTAIGGWLATVTRRHALKRLQVHVREHLSDDPELGDRSDEDQPEATLLALERRAILEAAIAKLPRRERDLMIVLLTKPTLDYRKIGTLLSMPVGSIGPIRGRSLTRLARDAQLRALTDTALVAV